VSTRPDPDPVSGGIRHDPQDLQDPHGKRGTLLNRDQAHDACCSPSGTKT
jgi:hypothetical protein